MFVKLSENINEVILSWEKCLLCTAEGIQDMPYHVRRNHLKRGVVCVWNHEEGYSLLCKLSCGMHSEEHGHFHCPGCSKSFSRGFTLRRHIGELHCTEETTVKKVKSSKYNKPGKKRPQRTICNKDHPTKTKKLKTQNSFTKLSDGDVSENGNVSFDLDKHNILKDEKLTYFCDQTFDEYVDQFAAVTSCPLCKHQSSIPSQLVRHLQTIHLNYSVWFICGETTYCCLPCKRNCLSSKLQSFKTHFHCPWCKRVMLRSARFKQHVTSRSGRCALHATLKQPMTKLNFDSTPNKEVKNGPEVVTVFVDDQELHNLETSEDDTNARNFFANAEFRQTNSDNKKKKSSGIHEESLQYESNREKRQLADKLFLESLLPEMEKVADDRKLKLKMDMLHLLHNAVYIGENLMESPVAEDGHWT